MRESRLYIKGTGIQYFNLFIYKQNGLNNQITKNYTNDLKDPN